MFATNLQKALDAKGWNRHHLAAELTATGLPVSESTVRGWLAGSYVPRAHILIAVARILGTNAEAMLAA